MKLSKQFTRREKVLLIILALLLLFAVYFLAVHRPVTEALDRIRTESETISSDLVVLEAKHQRMEQMQKELDEILAQPNVAEIPTYDNLQQVMDFLNTVLRSASEYSLSFQNLSQPEDGSILRRTTQMAFVSPSYKEAQDMVAPAAADGQSQDTAAALTDGPVEVSVTVTFFEKLS